MTLRERIEEELTQRFPVVSQYVMEEPFSNTEYWNWRTNYYAYNAD